MPTDFAVHVLRYEIDNPKPVGVATPTGRFEDRTDSQNMSDGVASPVTLRRLMGISKSTPHLTRFLARSNGAKMR
jgi:hypothetical protein